MDNTLLPDSIDHFIQDALTPEFWSKAFTILITAILILVFFRILRIILDRGMKKSIPEQKAQLILKAGNVASR